MKILEKEIDFNFYNLEQMEKFEKSAEAASNKLNEIDYNSLKQTEFIKQVCDIVYSCFDEIWGEGTAKEIFNNQKDFRLCVKAFGDLTKARKEQEKEIEKEIYQFQEELTDKYSAERTKR